MAFSTISSLAISVGSAIKAELWNKVKNNFDDHETRINLLETSSTKIDIFDLLITNKNPTPIGTSIVYFNAYTPMKITSCYIQMFAKGSLTGILDVDVKKSITNNNDTSFTSVFTTRPSLNYATAADYSKSTNQVLDSTKTSLVVGDILKVDIISIPSGAIFDKFILKMYGEP